MAGFLHCRRLALNTTPQPPAQRQARPVRLAEPAIARPTLQYPFRAGNDLAHDAVLAGGRCVRGGAEPGCVPAVASRVHPALWPAAGARARPLPGRTRRSTVPDRHQSSPQVPPSAEAGQLGRRTPAQAECDLSAKNPQEAGCAGHPLPAGQSARSSPRPIRRGEPAAHARRHVALCELHGLLAWPDRGPGRRRPPPPRQQSRQLPRRPCPRSCRASFHEIPGQAVQRRWKAPPDLSPPSVGCPIRRLTERS